MTVTVARQPIFDKKLTTYAYELLYRGEHALDDSNSHAGDTATNHIISHSLLDVKLEKIVGDHIAFINMTRTFLLKGDPLPLTQDRVVLEILENIVIDDEVIQAVKKLVEQGYKIALDDFVYHDSLAPLVKLAHFIKIDILALTLEELTEHVNILKTENVLLLAEKVETQQQFELCQQLGFDYYQGYFFSRPLHNPNIPLHPHQISWLTLIGDLLSPGLTLNKACTLFAKNVALNETLLHFAQKKLLPSSMVSSSIEHCLDQLGIQPIQTWAIVIAINSIESPSPELSTLSLMRAKMCEQLAPHFGYDKETGFILGLLSTLDALLTHPMNELIDSLPLENEVKRALLTQGGPLGTVLQTTILYEQSPSEKLTEALSQEQLSEIYIASTQWTLDIQHLL